MCLEPGRESVVQREQEDGTGHGREKGRQRVEAPHGSLQRVPGRPEEDEYECQRVGKAGGAPQWGQGRPEEDGRG